MHDQEVDLLKEEIEMLSKQMRHQCDVIHELKYMLARVTGQLQDHSTSMDMIYLNGLFAEVQNVLVKADLCK